MLPRDFVADRKHTLGAFLIWVGILLALVTVIFLLPRAPYWGAVAFLVSLSASLSGVYLKKRYCPRGRDNACALEKPSEAKSTHEDPGAHTDGRRNERGN